MGVGLVIAVVWIARSPLLYLALSMPEVFTDARGKDRTFQLK